MKIAIIICITAVLVAIAICGSVSLNNYVNRDRPHVYSAEDVYSNECAKRGGNPKTEIGRDYTGDRDVSVKTFTCEGVE